MKQGLSVMYWTSRAVGALHATNNDSTGKDKSTKELLDIKFQNHKAKVIHIHSIATKKNSLYIINHYQIDICLTF